DLKNDGLLAFLKMLRHALAHAKFELHGDGAVLNGVHVKNQSTTNGIQGFWVGFELRTAVRKLAEVIVRASKTTQ
nr:hypothetical protein [Fimbriimonadaceae bacterium]